MYFFDLTIAWISATRVHPTKEETKYKKVADTIVAESHQEKPKDIFAYSNIYWECVGKILNAYVSVKSEPEDQIPILEEIFEIKKQINETDGDTTELEQKLLELEKKRKFYICVKTGKKMREIECKEYEVDHARNVNEMIGNNNPTGLDFTKVQLDTDIRNTLINQFIAEMPEDDKENKGDDEIREFMYNQTQYVPLKGELRQYFALKSRSPWYRKQLKQLRSCIQ